MLVDSVTQLWVPTLSAPALSITVVELTVVVLVLAVRLAWTQSKKYFAVKPAEVRSHKGRKGLFPTSTKFFSSTGRNNGISAPVPCATGYMEMRQSRVDSHGIVTDWDLISPDSVPHSLEEMPPITIKPEFWEPFPPIERKYQFGYPEEPDSDHTDFESLQRSEMGIFDQGLDQNTPPADLSPSMHAYRVHPRDSNSNQLSVHESHPFEDPLNLQGSVLQHRLPSDYADIDTVIPLDPGTAGIDAVDDWSMETRRTLVNTGHQRLAVIPSAASESFADPLSLSFGIDVDFTAACDGPTIMPTYVPSRVYAENSRPSASRSGSQHNLYPGKISKRKPDSGARWHLNEYMSTTPPSPPVGTYYSPSLDESPEQCGATESIGSSSGTGTSSREQSPASSVAGDVVRTQSHQCPHCPAQFRIKGYLTRHVKKHAEQKAYTCPFYEESDDQKCHMTGGFSRRDTYKTHLKARHFVYPAGTPCKARPHVSGVCGGCGAMFGNNEDWIEQHIVTGHCPSFRNAITVLNHKASLQ